MDYQSCRNVTASSPPSDKTSVTAARRELTQEKLAEKAGLDPTYISGIERGLRNPGIKNVARLAKALSLTTAELCKEVDA